jgi:transcriptional regulator with XRE-family HTH domain
MKSRLDIPKLVAAFDTKRKREDLSLREVAADITGISASTLSRIGETNIQINNFLALCDWLEQPPAHFIISESVGEQQLDIDKLAYMQAQIRDCPLPPGAAASISQLLETLWLD